MISRIGRFLAGAYARAAIATMISVVAVVLVIDFADRAYSFQGSNWFTNVVQLYANLSVELAYQVAPAALLLAAGIAVSGLRQQGELTALHSLGISPRRVIGSVLVACGLAAGLCVVMNEVVVVDAARRAEEIKAAKFRRAGDFRAYFEQKRWFRSGNRIYNLRQSGEENAFGEVTIYELGKDFDLLRRIDAKEMKPNAEGRWVLENATVQRFSNGERSSAQRHFKLELDLPESPQDFQLRVGRPRQMGMLALIDQIRVREKLGLESADYRHELHNRIAYPFAAVPGALLAIRLALRRGRKGHLATSLAEGIVVSLVVWVMLTVFRALGVSGQLDPSVAAWAPTAILALVGLGAGLVAAGIEGRPVPAVAG